MLSSLAIIMIVLGALVGGYILTSYLLLRFPTLIHKKKNLRFKAVHISHRGGAGENLENTITAFEHAKEQGTDMFEIDCHITKDGQVVVSHDNSLKRATNENYLVSEMMYDDLPPLKQTLRLDFMWKHVTYSSTKDRKIPLLKDLFEKFPDIPVNIDIKIDDDELITKVSDLVREYKREALTVWGNRSDVITRKCFKENSDIPLLFSFRRVAALLAMYYSGILPFVSLRESAFEIPMPSLLLKDGLFETSFGWKGRTIIRIADFILMSSGLFRHLSARGIQTYFWVLNEEDDFNRAFRFGATGVMTDFPTKLRKFLDENPHFESF